jgi:hypothetical protein
MNSKNQEGSQPFDPINDQSDRKETNVPEHLLR